VLNDLQTLSISDVYVSGKLTAHNGNLCEPVKPSQVELPQASAKVAPLKLADFRITIPGMNRGHVKLKSIKGVRFSEWSETRLGVVDGNVELPPNADLNLIFAVHRHGKKDPQPHVAIQEGLAQLKGAIATTYEHDSHNLFVIGGNEEDMLLAANTLIASGGGIAVVQGSKVLAVAEFPIAGMLSAGAPEEVARLFRDVREAAGKVAVWKAPNWSFKTLEGMSLACNPFPYLTDMGLVDGKTGQLVDMILELQPA
jgi:adenine deaminase